MPSIIDRITSIIAPSGKPRDEELRELETPQRVHLDQGIVPAKTRVYTSNGLPADRAGECLPAQPIVAPQPTPDASPELAAAESLLAFFVGEYNQGQASMAEFPRSSFTPMPDQVSRCRQYRAALEARRSLVREPSTDLPLLLAVLRSPNSAISQDGGLIAEAAAKVNVLKTPPPAEPSEEYQRLIAAEDKAFRAWGKARNARRAFEEKLPPATPRHEYKTPRAAFGVNFGQVDSITVQRVADMACSLPSGQK